MSNNCLVTKLKGTVQNDNLPIFNTIRVDLLSSTSREGESNIILIGTGNETVTITSKVPFHISSPESQSYYEYTLLVNSLYSIVFISSEVGDQFIKNAVLVSGGIYSLTAFSFYGNCGWFAVSNVDKESLLCSNNIISYVCSFGQRTKQQIEVLTIDDTIITRYNYSSIIPVNNNIKFISGNNINGSPIGVNASDLQKMPVLQKVRVRINGSIVDLPITVNELQSVSSITNGNIEDFVSDRRAKGKTSGYLAIANPNIYWNIYYNGTRIINYPSSVIPMDENNRTYLVWTESTIQFTDVAPEGFNHYGSIYWATKAVLDGNL